MDLDQEDENTMNAKFLNIRSLKAHHEDLFRETCVNNSQVICLCETKLTNYDKYEIERMVCISVNNSHGSVVFTSTSFERQNIIIAAKLESIEAIALKVKSVTIVYVYFPPTTSLTVVKKDFQSLLQELKPSSENNCVILCDCNLDNNKRQRFLCTIIWT
ncbi:hypothetical protein DPMN_105416 [Dreissena polymorpha]|uniref:Endonuclease/exonuclease/phosphatase domain-containing protein n=1 Tax=Dreissena polymorpha TaxID=45954 RepID=A0A9D4HEQ5_DREPO|nr:hypothetical protein DPMN_105416 [Dreissena polymorpha]